MDYKALFNLLYSTEISEAAKADIVDKIDFPIEESVEVESLIETYLELLDTLVYSTVSEDLINNIIDTAFSQLDEAIINEVSDEWIKRKVEAGVKQRESAYNKAKDNIIGLSSVAKANKAGERLEAAKNFKVPERSYNKPSASTTSTTQTPSNAEKKEGVLGKLKSAVGKVKNWVDSKSPAPKPVSHAGLSRIIGAKANKEGIGAEDLRKQTTRKVSSTANSTTQAGTANTQTTKAKSTPKTKSTSTGVSSSTQEGNKEAKPATIKKTKASGVKSEVKANNATKAAKETAKKAGAKTTATKTTAKKTTKKAETPEKTAEQTKLKLEAPEETKKTTKKAQAEASKEEAPVNAETSKGQSEAPEVSAGTNKEETSQSRQKITNVVGFDGKPKASSGSASAPSKIFLNPKSFSSVETKKKRSVDDEIEALMNSKHEALSDLAYLLLHTNISESCFLEVFEMLKVNKENAQAAMNRDEEHALAIADDINKDLSNGKPLDPEKVKKAEDLANKKARLEKIFDKKFNNNN